jgi:hypothetical protein
VALERRVWPRPDRRPSLQRLREPRLEAWIAEPTTLALDVLARAMSVLARDHQVEAHVALLRP